MIEITRNPTIELQDDRAANKLLTRVHADFETVTDKPGKRHSLPGEDVFWWCITILKEVGDMESPPTTREAYVLMMLDQLRSMGPRLKNTEPPPPEFQLHWFHDTDDRAVARRGAAHRQRPRQRAPPTPGRTRDPRRSHSAEHPEAARATPPRPGPPPPAAPRSAARPPRCSTAQELLLEKLPD